MIESLVESLPSIRMGKAVASSGATDPLEFILQPIREFKLGCVCLVGLESAIPSDQTRHPIVQSLNLRRTEWASKVSIPVVLWIPEYLLGILGREAPDFLDWRSDTLYFPTTTEPAIAPLNSRLWQAGYPVSKRGQRVDRIDELKSRLALAKNESKDLRVVRFRAVWRFELANLLNAQGDVETSEQEFKRAAADYQAAGDRLGLANCLGSLASIAIAKGDLNVAEEKLLLALTLHEEFGRTHEVALDYTFLADISLRRGDVERAKGYAVRALQIHRDMGHELSIAQDLRTLGNIYRFIGDLPSAERHYLDAMEIERRGGNAESLAESLRCLATLSQETGDLSRAEALIREAIQLDEETGTAENVSVDYGVLGSIVATRGDMTAAAAAFEKGISFSSERKTQTNAMHYENLGRIAATENRWDDAIQYFEKSLELDQSLKNFARSGQDFLLLANIEEKRGDIDKARAHRQTAREAYAKAGALHLISDEQANLDDQHRSLESLIAEVRKQPTPSSLQGAFLFAAKLQDRPSLQILMEILRENPAIVRTEPGVTQTIAIALINLNEFDWADEVLEIGKQFASSATGFNEAFYLLNKLQINAHKGVPLEPDEISKLEALAKSDSVLTTMGANILLRNYAKAESDLRKAISLRKVDADGVKHWPIFKLLEPYLKSSL